MSPDMADRLVDQAADAARATIALQIACQRDYAPLDNDETCGAIEWGIYAGILATIETMLAQGILEGEGDG